MREIRLSNGVSIPSVGLGVFRAPAREAFAAVSEALRAGYRHVDTAQVYGNEAEVGAAIRESGLPRSEIFVTTKLWNSEHGRVRAAFEGSEQRLGVGVDLFLLHWPVPGRRLEAWRGLEALYREGRVRAIGVSNFMVPHLDELAAKAEILPQVNQIEVHPFHQQAAVRAWCAARGVVVEAYSPLTKGLRLGHPVVTEIAARLGRSPAQVLLRWGLQKGMAVLPKSVRPARIAENIALFDFELSAADMAALDGLEEGLATGWDPRGQP